ncbi:MAG: BMP family ABC transporter substrate-binding protein [Oscillospiraceae bacterium]|nr:BMP family ABC transporter substrate-binding protein [Oscillospiraceae bacterium]
MSILEAKEEYIRALKAGQKQQKELLSKGLLEYPAVLDSFVSEGDIDHTEDLGLMELPANLIVGTKTAGRITAFTPSFLPLLPVETEFASKWVMLCAAHLSDEGIRDPIVCFEYMGKFYVQEGNKRVSVLRYFDAPRIPGYVTRLLPKKSDDPAVVCYYEFLDFYKDTGIYDVQFRQPGDYGKLLSHLGKAPGEQWTEQEKKTFRANFYYFREAFEACKGETLNLLPEEALLLWLRVYPFKDLGKLSATRLKKAMSGLWENLVTIAQDEPVQVTTEPTEGKASLLTMLTNPSHVNVAFVHQRDLLSSAWTTGHEEGAQQLKDVLGDKVTVRSYFHADTPEETERLLHLAVAEGADVVFTTTPPMGRPTLKVALQYPKVRFLNCSVDAPYSSIRTYYSRIFEGKFITGAIAGALSDNNTIGYVGSYPIFGVPASINAFALGAQLTNPRARVMLRWSCQAGSPGEDFMKAGIQVVSNRDVPLPGRIHLEHGSYGTYTVAPDGTHTTMGSPCWMWGKFYVHVVESILNGTWDQGTQADKAVNYWWGMDSGVIDVTLSDHLPEGLRHLANILRSGLQNGTIDPFRRRLVAQDGTVKNDGSRSLTPEELLHMDWLCENVDGEIPPFETILPYSQTMVRELGVYRDSIPMEKEGTL